MVVQAQGSEAQVLMGFETNYGEQPATPTVYKVPFISNNIRSEQNLNEDETIRDDKNPAKPTRGNQNVNGDHVFYIDEENIGLFLKAMFGSPTTTDDLADGIDVNHVFKVGAGQPSFFLEKGFTDIGSYHLFNGCKVSSFSTEFGGDGDVRGTVTVIGAKETTAGASIDAAPTVLNYNKFSQFQASIEEGGSQIAIVTRATLDVNFNLDDNDNNYYIGGGGVRGQLPEGIVAVTGTITAWFVNQTLLDKAINGTETSLKFALTNGSNSLTFFLPEVMYERTTPPVEGPQGVMIELPYRAYYENNADATCLKTTLINEVLSY